MGILSVENQNCDDKVIRGFVNCTSSVIFTMQNSSVENCDKVSSGTETEHEICSFYIMILKDLCKLYHLRFEDIRTALSTIRSYKNPEVEIHDIVSFDEKLMRIAYIFAYCLIHSVVMFDHFSCVLKSNPTMSEKIISMKKLRLCFLGGGPGFEAVALCKILSILRKKFDVKSHGLLLNVTIIDICEGWEEDAKCIISLAQNEICIPTNTTIDFKFITADLTSDFPGDVKKVLKKAHIVTMFKFLSDVNDSSYSKSEIHQMIRKIIECMSFRACLFFLDNAGGNISKDTVKIIDELSHTFNIYTSSRYSCHKLSIDSVEMISDSLKSIFRYLKCTAQTTISCSAWLKVRNSVNVDDLKSGIITISMHNPVNDPDPSKLKIKGRKVKVKKMLQSASKLRELCSNSESESE